MTDMEVKRARGKCIANALVCQLCWTFLLINQSVFICRPNSLSGKNPHHLTFYWSHTYYAFAMLWMFRRQYSREPGWSLYNVSHEQSVVDDIWSSSDDKLLSVDRRRVEPKTFTHLFAQITIEILLQPRSVYNSQNLNPMHCHLGSNF